MASSAELVNLAAYDKALALKPDLAEAWLGRGNVFFELKRYDEAFAAYDKAFSLKPELAGAEGARLHAKMHLCDWSNFDAEVRPFNRFSKGWKKQYVAIYISCHSFIPRRPTPMRQVVGRRKIPSISKAYLAR